MWGSFCSPKVKPKFRLIFNWVISYFSIYLWKGSKLGHRLLLHPCLSIPKICWFACSLLLQVCKNSAFNTSVLSLGFFGGGMTSLFRNVCFEVLHPQISNSIIQFFWFHICWCLLMMASQSNINCLFSISASKKKWAKLFLDVVINHMYFLQFSLCLNVKYFDWFKWACIFIGLRSVRIFKKRSKMDKAFFF